MYAGTLVGAGTGTHSFLDPSGRDIPAKAAGVGSMFRTSPSKRGLPKAPADDAARERAAEGGTVLWLRSLDAALSDSARTGKPVFALFQEVPGCAGCRQFGREVMSHPLVSAAVEEQFVPLLVHNNKPGADDAVRVRYNEPAWNYQVVRFLDSSGDDLIPRTDGVWTTGPLAERMVAALEAAGQHAPEWLRLTASEHSGALATAALSMACFWVGEAHLGRIEGVITTEAGFLGGREVVLLRYDPSALKLSSLVALARESDSARTVHVAENSRAATISAGVGAGALSGYRRAPPSDQKRQLQGTPAARLGIEGSQATKVNAWIRVDSARAASFLTAAQRERLGLIRPP